jgi:hypothetical protein
MTPHPTIIAAAKLLKEKWPTCSTWNDDELLNWIGIFNSKRQIGIVMDGNECVGVGAVRFLNSIEEAKDIHNNDLNGHIAWIEVVVTSKPFAVHTLWMAMKQRCGPNVTKMGGNNVHTGVSRLYDFERYFKLLMNERICYGRIIQSA